MKKDDQFYLDVQRYVAVTTIGPSALRNQGSAGVIKAAQNYLAIIDLGAFRTKDERTFLRVLDTATEKLTHTLPRGAQNWGAARKACNLFLRDICYNRFPEGLSIGVCWLLTAVDKGIDGELRQYLGRHRTRGSKRSARARGHKNDDDLRASKSCTCERP